MSDALSRRDQILYALAHMLETQLGKKITTAKLAEAVGVSEAALYRHFPSKAKMFEGLVVFMEETIFSRVNLIIQEEQTVVARCQGIVQLLLAFAERNPGLCRILIGDALVGDLVRIKSRVVQLFDRLETQLKQVIREAELREGVRPLVPQSVAANLLLLFAEGKINQFVRSEFKRKPSDDFQIQWRCLCGSIFQDELLFS